MNRGEMRTHVRDLLADADITSDIWESEDLANELLDQGCKETGKRLPPEEVLILLKEKTVDLAISEDEYSIESSPFSLTDYDRYVELWVKDSDSGSLRPAGFVHKHLLGNANPFYKGTKYAPRFTVAAKLDDATEHAITIDPPASATITDGLKLVYIALTNTLSDDAHISVLPAQYHKLACQYTAAVLLAMNRQADAQPFWDMWRTALIDENRKYGHSIEIEKEPPK